MIPVSIDVGRGRATLGGLEVRLSEVRGSGEIRLGDSAGPLLRPLKFVERTRIVEWARRVPERNASVAASVAAIATVEPGVADPVVIEIVALHLAGAGIEAPSFADTALLLARTSGWRYREIEVMDAAEADRLAAGIAGPRASSGDWMQFVFASRAEDSLESIRRQLVEDLLARAAGGVHLDPQDSRFEAPATDDAGMTDSADPIEHQLDAPSKTQVSSATIALGDTTSEPLIDSRTRTHTHRPGSRPSASGRLSHGIAHDRAGSDFSQSEPAPRNPLESPPPQTGEENQARPVQSGFARMRWRAGHHPADSLPLDIPQFPLPSVPAAEPAQPHTTAALDLTLDGIAAALEEECDLRGLL